jgi:glycosyltransferase involved in cell wall biosynthesis
MNILHVVPSLSVDWGGTTSSVLEITHALQGVNVRMVVAGTFVESEAARISRPRNMESHLFPCTAGSAWRYSPGLRRFLDIHTREYDVVHVHGLWLYPQYAAVRAAVRSHVPVAISTHGMLSAWALQHRSWKKRIYYRMLLERQLRQASVIHAVTAEERQDVLKLLPGARIEVVPHVLDTASSDVGCEPVARRAGQASANRTILFLGRIHRVKGLDALIEAFVRSETHWRYALVIAGPAEDRDYLRELKVLAERRGVGEKVRFPGPVYGADKWELLRTAWIVVLPSHSEVIGMVNLESARCETPSITTRATGLSDWGQGGGLLVDSPCDVGALADAIREACDWSEDERRRRGLASRALIESHYSISAVAPKWLELYASAARKGVK